MTAAKPFSVSMALPLILAVALTLSPLHPPAAAAHEHRDGGDVSLIIDSDMGLDDARAILALLSDTLVTIRAFIVTGGSASIGKGTDNLIGLLESSHGEHIPVYVGATHEESDPPPWRETAETMGGDPFPPPRTAHALAGSLGEVCEIMAHRSGPITYVMLGPASTLALLAHECPSGLRGLGEILIPAEVTPEGAVNSWNLRYDGAAAGVVMAEARNIVFIDIPAAGEIDAEAAFSALGATSPAARWIRETTADDEHRFLCDELAAVAAARPAMRAPRGKRCTARMREDGTLSLELSEGGTVAIAGLDDMEQSIRLLANLWERPPRETAASMSHETIPPDTYLRAFHGHLGPYVVLGYRMGRLALEITGSAGHFDCSVTVHCVLKPPRSCLIDGVQLGSGCTLGKRNIEIREFSGVPYAVFRTERAGAVTIRLRPELPELITRLIERMGVEAAGEMLLERDIGSIFIVEEGPAE
jgi:inosine-uridine nucleoside N-ribohydrolase